MEGIIPTLLNQLTIHGSEARKTFDQVSKDVISSKSGREETTERGGCRQPRKRGCSRTESDDSCLRLEL